ncbi:MAG: hypothetical protein QM676_06670 [Novosphingobium sp.]
MNVPFVPPSECVQTWAEDKRDCLLWQAYCLQQFAQIEQEVALTLDCLDHAGEGDATKRLGALLGILQRSDDKISKKLVLLLTGWAKRKVSRNMFAHGTMHVLQAEDGTRVAVVRHIGAAPVYDYADRMWFAEERTVFLTGLRREAQSITDRLRSLRANVSLMSTLKA